MSVPEELAVTPYARADFSLVRQQLIDVYAEVYADEALADPFHSVPRFTDRLDGHASRPGWACSVGTIDGETVGYAYGRPDSEGEWRRVTDPVSPDVHDYGVGGAMFGLCEIMVREPWRGTGIARVIHDALMRDRPELRASLLVDRTHPRVRATYERWGYRAVATAQPFPDSPVYDAMVLDLGSSGWAVGV